MPPRKKPPLKNLQDPGLDGLKQTKLAGLLVGATSTSPLAGPPTPPPPPAAAPASLAGAAASPIFPVVALPTTPAKATPAPARLGQEVTAKQLATIRRNMEFLLSDDGPSGGMGAGGGEDRKDRPKPAPNSGPFKKGAQDAFMGF